MARKRAARVTLNVLLVVVLTGVALLAFRATRSDGSQAQDDALQTATVTRGDVVETVSTSATIESAQTVSVNFAAAGTLSSVPVRIGQRVQQGEVIGRLDATATRQQLVAARMALRSAEASLVTEQKNLGCKTAAACPTWADPQLLSAKSSVASAKLQVQQDLTTLRQAVLRAPIAGTVVALDGTVGQSVVAGTTSSSSSSSSTDSTTSDYAQIADLSHLVAVGDFSETDSAKIERGQDAAVTLDSQPDVTVAGHVALIALTSTVTNNVVNYEVTVRMEQPPAGVRLGETGSVQVTVAGATNVLTVPSVAVTALGGQNTVTVLSGSTTTRTPVQVGVEGDSSTEIVSGLSEGQQVVISTASTSGTGGFPGGGFPGGGFGGVPGGGPGGP